MSQNKELSFAERQANAGRLICIPKAGEPRKFHWYRLPEDIYRPKVWPTCKCGKKFVPIPHIKGAKKQCLFCVFGHNRYQQVIHT